MAIDLARKNGVFNFTRFKLKHCTTVTIYNTVYTYDMGRQTRKKANKKNANNNFDCSRNTISYWVFNNI